MEGVVRQWRQWRQLVWQVSGGEELLVVVMVMLVMVREVPGAPVPTMSLRGRTRGGRGKMCVQSLKARRVGGCIEKGRYRGSSKEGEIERERVRGKFSGMGDGTAERKREIESEREEEEGEDKIVVKKEEEEKEGSCKGRKQK